MPRNPKVDRHLKTWNGWTVGEDVHLVLTNNSRTRTRAGPTRHDNSDPGTS
jgi:hypothetical protein